MALEGPVMWVIGLLVIAIVAVNIVIPTALSEIDGMDITGSITGETYNATASTAYALANVPIVQVNFNGLSTATTATNNTGISGNETANVTETFTLLTPLDDGAVSGRTYNVTAGFLIGVDSNVTVTAQGAVLGTISSNSTNTWTGLSGNLTTPFTVRFTFNGANISNVTNVSVGYSYFAANTGYTTNTAAGTITQNTTGTYYTTYDFGTVGSTNAKTILLLVPLLLGVALLYVVLQPIMGG